MLPVQKLIKTLLSSSALAASLIVGDALAQFSGGPYGPLDQSYEIPKAKRVYFVAPDGKAEASGSELTAPTTLEQAFARVVSGDAIILRGGIYRTGSLRLNQGISIQPYKDEKPVLKGTEIASDWQVVGENVWRTS